MKFKNHIFLISAGLTFISLLVLIPSVSADVLFPAIMRLAPINFVFLPVIIFIEATIFYVLFMIDLFFDIKLKYWHCLALFTLANGLTSLIGLILIFAEIRVYDYNQMIIIMYVFSAVVEAMVIFPFLRQKIKKPFEKSLGLSFFVNVYSYIFLFILMNIL